MWLLCLCAPTSGAARCSAAKREEVVLGARVSLCDERALLAGFFDHQEGLFFLEHSLIAFLVAGHNNECLRVRPHCLVLPLCQQDDLGAALVLAFTQVGSALVTQAELGRLLLEHLVQASKSRLVLCGALCGSLHQRRTDALDIGSRNRRVFQTSAVGEDQRRMDPRQERVAKNETLFREVNERVEEVAVGLTGADSQLIGFICECGRDDCAEPLELRHEQYESVRENPLRFLIVPGHEQADVERVVERQARFLVVEKLGEGAQIAVEQDPRSEGAG